MSNNELFIQLVKYLSIASASYFACKMLFGIFKVVLFGGLALALAAGWLALHKQDISTTSSDFFDAYTSSNPLLGLTQFTLRLLKNGFSEGYNFLKEYFDIMLSFFDHSADSPTGEHPAKADNPKASLPVKETIIYQQLKSQVGIPLSHFVSLLLSKPSGYLPPASKKANP